MTVAKKRAAGRKAVPKRITAAWLDRREACLNQRWLFRKTFGASAAATRENLEKAATAGLNLLWLADKILDDAAFRRFLRAWERAAEARNRALYPDEYATGPTGPRIQAAYVAYNRRVAAALARELGL